MILLALLATGCANVAPWERGRLAHPSMAPDARASVGREHMHAVQEGATGGAVTVESSCGCN
jgi:hypothetical protein